MHVVSSMIVYGWFIQQQPRVLPAAHLPPVRPDEGPVGAVHLVVKATGVAQVVSRAVPAPQRRGHRAAVHTLTALAAHVVNQV